MLDSGTTSVALLTVDILGLQHATVQAVRTAIVNKRAGGTGLISGRKAFQRPRQEGIELLNAIQDVYLEDQITVA